MIRKCDYCEHHRPESKLFKECSTCDGACNFKEKLRMHPVQRAEYLALVRLENWINDISVKYDNKTALFIFNTLIEHMHVRCDINGEYIYSIKADIFNAIQTKILDTKEEK